MKIDFATVLRDKKGEPMKAEDEKEVTLGNVAETALLASFQDEALKLEGSEKVKRFKIAMKIDGVTDMTPEEVVKIKELVGKAFGPLIVGRAYEILDGGTKEKTK
jgi:hypothetical protein